MSRVITSRNRLNKDEGIDLRAEVEALSPEERKVVLDDYAGQLDVDAMLARRRGWFEQANFLAELAHQMRCGHVIMPGDFPGMESLLDDERRREEETLNTYERPSMPAIYNIN